LGYHDLEAENEALIFESVPKRASAIPKPVAFMPASAQLCMKLGADQVKIVTVSVSDRGIISKKWGVFGV
jgi:hypothetical protein